MASTREISERIKSVQDTRKITNAMYMISSTKLNRAKREMEGNAPYFAEMQSILLSMVESSPYMEHKFIDAREDKERSERTNGVLVITGDKGLCGAYNHNVCKLVESTFANREESLRLYVVGEVGRQYFVHKGIKIAGSFRYTAQNPTLYRARGITNTLIDEFLSGKVDDVSIVYTAMPKPMVTQACVMHLLPLVKEEVLGRISDDIEVKEELNFIPDAGSVLTNIVPDVLMGFVYSALVDSFCSEQNDRMMAMNNANSNADEMLRDLSVQYNRQRQAKITSEITEVAAGAKAQKNKAVIKDE